MNRDKLIQQVKSHYARLASEESHITQSTNSIAPDKYYENLLHMVITEIQAGTFDSCNSGREIMEIIANDKRKWLSKWKQGNTTF